MSSPDQQERRGSPGSKPGSPASHRGSPDSVGRFASTFDGRGSEESLVGEGVSLEKQDTETKEKKQGRGGGDGRGQEEAGCSDQGRGQDEGRVLTPVELEVGQVIYAPAPPMSTSMPAPRRRMSKEDEEKREGEATEKITSLTMEDLETKDENRDRESPEPSEIVEETTVADKYFSSFQPPVETLPSPPEKKHRVDDDDDDDDPDEDEVIRSVSDDEDRDYEDDVSQYSDDTLPLRNSSSFPPGLLPHGHSFAKYESLLRDHPHHTGTDPGLGREDDRDSSVVSDVFSPRPKHEQQRALSMARFRAQMPKFSTKAYAFTSPRTSPVHRSHGALMGMADSSMQDSGLDISAYFLDDEPPDRTQPQQPQLATDNGLDHQVGMIVLYHFYNHD